MIERLLLPARVQRTQLVEDRFSTLRDLASKHAVAASDGCTLELRVGVAADQFGVSALDDAF